jgi:hypothetical protein
VDCLHTRSRTCLPYGTCRSPQTSSTPSSRGRRAPRRARWTLVPRSCEVATAGVRSTRRVPTASAQAVCKRRRPELVILRSRRPADGYRAAEAKAAKDGRRAAEAKAAEDARRAAEAQAAHRAAEAAASRCPLRVGRLLYPALQCGVLHWGRSGCIRHIDYVACHL